MKIAIVTDAWTPQINGVVTTLLNTIDGLEKLGHTVSVIEPSQYKGFTIWLLKGLKLSMPPYRMDTRLADADAIHIATEGPLGYAAKRYCDKRRLPYTTAFHTNYSVYMEDHFGLPKSVGLSFLRWFHRYSASMMVPAQSLIDQLKTHGFTNTALWGRGVDPEIFYAGRASLTHYCMSKFGPSPFWLSVGRVSKEKNLDAFLSLVLPGTKFVVGDGPERARLEATYPEAVFLGSKRSQDLADVYRAADVFVFPSRFDTYGLVIAESIACGTPVAAFPVTGPIDIVEDGVSGFLNEDLQQACMASLTIPNPVKMFSWDDATSQFCSNLVRCR